MSSKQWKLAVIGWCVLGIPGLLAQNAQPRPGESQTSTPAQPQEAAPQEPQHSGTVLFSRSTDDPANKISVPAQAHVSQPAPPVSDQERNALTFLDYNFDVRLMPRQESLAVRAQITARNDGEQPLKQIALQLSSLLNWEEIKVNGARAQFATHTLDTDADHTGSVNEAVVTLRPLLAPKGELKLDVLYSGQIPVNAHRLERIQAPSEIAQHSDWDRISPEFTGIRGFGNVIWYPVSAPPAMLGDGAKLFTEIGQQKLRQSPAKVQMTVTGEWFAADANAPDIAILDGHVVAVQQKAAPEASYPGVVTASLPETRLGFAVPSIFLATRKEQETGSADLWLREEDNANAAAFSSAADLLNPLLHQWLGPKPRQPFAILDLPETEDAGADENSILLAPVKSSDPHALPPELIPALTHSFFVSPRPWLSDGVAQFMQTLWTEQTQGRQAALEQLESARRALALAEPATPGDAGAQDLNHTSEQAYYNGKAAYIFWMLRDIAGDGALASALHAYSPQDDTTPDYFQHLLEKSSGKDLGWFFNSWVYHDRGLPDLSITGVFPSKSATAGQYLVALDLANDGFADAEVPVTVRSGDTSVTERLRLPARSKLAHRILIQGVPTEVQLNDGTVPEVQASVHLENLTRETGSNRSQP